MKRQLIIVAAMMLATIHIKSQTMMNLTDKQQALVAIAANEAKGDMDALKKESNEWLEPVTDEWYNKETK